MEHLLVLGRQTYLSLVHLVECELCSYICLLNAFSHFLFLASKPLFFKLNSFCAKVLLFYSLFLLLPTHF